MKTLLPFLLIVVTLLSSCASSKLMNRLSIGMTKQQVFKAMGEPDSVAAEGNYEVLRYVLARNFQEANYGVGATYFVALVNGRVVKFGQRGDFGSAQNPQLDLNIQHR